MMPNRNFRYQKLFLCKEIIGLRLSGIHLKDTMDGFVWESEKQIIFPGIMYSNREIVMNKKDN